VISTERPEFEKHLAVLCAGLDTPCTEDRKQAYWIGLQRMPLSLFARTVNYMLEEEDWRRIPKPKQIWTSSGRLRAKAPEQPRDDGWRGDLWDMAANRYLLGHILNAMNVNPRCYGAPASVRALAADQRALDVAGLDKHQLDASPEFINQVGRLVEAKSLWAADMRDIAVNGEVPVEMQKAVWRDYIERAEKDLATNDPRETPDTQHQTKQATP
jgi:hypothetical protein